MDSAHPTASGQKPQAHENDPSIPPPSDEEVLRSLLHCGSPFVMKFASDMTQIQHAGKMDYVFDESLVDKDEDGNPRMHFEYAEHVYLGDALALQWHDGATYLGRDKKFRLGNGLELTYGQICALGGDFFGNEQPICLGGNFEEQIKRFDKGYATLAQNTASKSEAERIIKLKSDEVTLLNDAAEGRYEGQSPSDVYATKMHSTRDDIVSTVLGIFSSRPKGYLGLSLINFDHFGEDARKAYNAGHTSALRKAASKKDAKALEDAYAMNAFADHFLEDQFAAGHLRLPRQKLHGTVRLDMDACSHFMHDEDNKTGLLVSNPRGETWRAYGDTMLLDDVDKSNLEKCHLALMTSTKEVFEAWKSGKVPAPASFGAWQYAPIIASAFSDKNHSPLFNSEGCPRVDINDKQCRKYESSSGNWTYPGLLLRLKKSPNF